MSLNDFNERKLRAEAYQAGLNEAASQISTLKAEIVGLQAELSKHYDVPRLQVVEDENAKLKVEVENSHGDVVKATDAAYALLTERDALARKCEGLEKIVREVVDWDRKHPQLESIVTELDGIIKRAVVALDGQKED